MNLYMNEEYAQLMELDNKTCNKTITNVTNQYEEKNSSKLITLPDELIFSDDKNHNLVIEQNWINLINSYGGRIKNGKGSRLGWFKEFVKAMGKPE